MTASNYFESGRALNISGVLVISIIGSLAVYSTSDSPQWPLVASLAAGMLATFVVFLVNQDDARSHILFWIIALLIAGLFFTVELDVVAILTIVWVVIAAELYGPRRAALLAMASILTFLLSQVYHSGLENLFGSLISAILYGLLQVFALSVVLRGIRERKLHEQAAQLNRELIATRELLSQSTAQAERVRIARDLHDLLGHHMTALILNLEVARHSIASDAGSETAERQGESKAEEKVEQALALAKLLLGDIRTAVSELREDDDINLLASIQRLTAGIPNLVFEIDFDAAPQIGSVQLAETMLRCVQEAITNIIRHSEASLCQIALTAKDRECELSIRDNGANRPEAVPGNGILGMRERVISQGGRLDWQQDENGFALQLVLPLDADDED